MIHKVHTKRRLEVNHEALWAAIADYQSLVSWMPGVSTSNLLVREGDVAAIELGVPHFKHENLVLEIVESFNKALRLQQVDFYDEHGLTAEIQLTPDGSTTEVEIEISITAPLLGFLFRKKLNATLQKILDATEKRAQAIVAGEIAVSGRRKILEVRQLTDSLEVWFRGETFVYKPKAKTTSAGGA